MFSCDDRHARQIIEHSDHDRYGFHKMFFNIDWEKTHLYDLVINTAVLSVDTAAALIKNAVNQFQKSSAEAKLKLKDLCLAQEIITKIIYTDKLSIRLLEVTATDGVVLLRGAVGTQAIIESCQQMVKDMPGVKEVISELYFQPQYVGN